MKRLHLLVAVSFLSNIGILSAQNRKSFDPIDLVNIKQVRDPQISPDRSMVAYVVETPIPAGERRSSQIWLVLSDGSAPARAFATSASNTCPRWSPDGSSLAFLSTRESLPAKSRTLKFSIVGAEDRKDIFPPDPKSSTTEERDAKPVDQIWLISAHGGEAMQVTDIPGSVKKFKWSTDGKQLAFVRTDQNTKQELELSLAKTIHPRIINRT